MRYASAVASSESLGSTVTSRLVALRHASMRGIWPSSGNPCAACSRSAREVILSSKYSRRNARPTPRSNPRNSAIAALRIGFGDTGLVGVAANERIRAPPSALKFCEICTWASCCCRSAALLLSRLQLAPAEGRYLRFDRVQAALQLLGDACQVVEALLAGVGHVGLHVAVGVLRRARSGRALRRDTDDVGVGAVARDTYDGDVAQCFRGRVADHLALHDCGCSSNVACRVRSRRGSVQALRSSARLDDDVGGCLIRLRLGHRERDGGCDTDDHAEDHDPAVAPERAAVVAQVGRAEIVVVDYFSHCRPLQPLLPPILTIVVRQFAVPNSNSAVSEPLPAGHPVDLELIRELGSRPGDLRPARRNGERRPAARPPYAGGYRSCVSSSRRVHCESVPVAHGGGNPCVQHGFRGYPGRDRLRRDRCVRSRAGDARRDRRGAGAGARHRGAREPPPRSGRHRERRSRAGDDPGARPGGRDRLLRWRSCAPSR